MEVGKCTLGCGLEDPVGGVTISQGTEELLERVTSTSLLPDIDRPGLRTDTRSVTTLIVNRRLVLTGLRLFPVPRGDHSSPSLIEYSVRGRPQSRSLSAYSHTTVDGTSSVVW